jgi:hypothetical protein
MTDWAELGFIVEVIVLLSTVPVAYASWASGVLAGMFDEAKANGWVWPPRNRKTQGQTASENWKNQYGQAYGPRKP